MLAKAKHGARHIGARFYGYYTWIVFAVLLLVFGGLALFASPVDRARRLAHFIARWMFRLSGISIAAAGLERLPVQPHVLVVNHASFLDGILLTALLPPTPGYTFTTRQQYTLQSLLWPFIRSLHILVLKHHDDSQHTVNLDILKSALERGQNLIVFPEGGFASEPGLKRLHSGAFIAAAQAHVPIVVVGLRGTRKALRVGTWMPKRLPLSIEIGPVLTPRGTDTDAIHELMLAAHAAMMPLTGESSAAG